MKKLLTAIVIATTIGTAQASSRANPCPSCSTYHAYNAGYKAGRHSGKQDAYDNVLRAAIAVGVVAFVGVVAHEASKPSRLTANQNGIVYRF